MGVKTQTHLRQKQQMANRAISGAAASIGGLLLNAPLAQTYKSSGHTVRVE